MSRRGCLITISLLVAAIAALVLWVRFGEFWKIDACVDSAGSWDYSAKECRH